MKMDYKTGTKNNWRRQCWNDIASRVPNKSEAKILYLAAEQDLDRPVAISKGFAANNMVAVDMRQTVVDKLRAEGKLAIQGKIEDVARAYKDVSVVYADFCWGLTENCFEAVKKLALMSQIPKGCVLLLNMQRGRENGHEADWIKSQQQDLGHGTNRADLCMHLILQAWLQRMMAWGDLDFKDTVAVDEFDLYEFTDEQEKRANEIAEAIRRLYAPKIISYRSSKGMYFDTLIITNFMEPHAINAAAKHPLSGEKVMRDVAAVRAVQTMRKNGRLEASPCV